MSLVYHNYNSENKYSLHEMIVHGELEPGSHFSAVFAASKLITGYFSITYLINK